MMVSSSALAVRCLALVLATWPLLMSHAQEPPRYSPTHLAAVERVLETMLVGEALRITVRDAVSKLKQQEPQRAERIGADLEAFLSSGRPYQDLALVVAGKVDEESSLANLQFWTGPVGRKLTQPQPQPRPTSGSPLDENELQTLQQFRQTHAFAQMTQAAPAVSDWLAKHYFRLMEGPRAAHK